MKTLATAIALGSILVATGCSSTRYDDPNKVEVAQLERNGTSTEHE